MKNSNGKWWTYGSLKTNQWGNEQISFKLDKLKELVAEAEKMEKEWVNLSLFDNDNKNNNSGKPNSSESVQKGLSDELDDEIPF